MQLQIMDGSQQVGVINVDDDVAKGKLSRKTQKAEAFSGKSGGVAYDTATLHCVFPGGKVQVGRPTRPATVTVWRVK